MKNIRKYLALGLAVVTVMSSMVACQNGNQANVTEETEIIETEVTEMAMTNADGALLDENGQTVETQVTVDESGNQVITDTAGNKIEKDAATGNYVVKKKVTQTQTKAQQVAQNNNNNNNNNNKTQAVTKAPVQTQATTAQTKAQTTAQTQKPATTAATTKATTAATKTPATQHSHSYTKDVQEPVYDTVKVRNPKYYHYSASGGRTWMADGSEPDAYITKKEIVGYRYYKVCSCGAKKLTLDTSK